MIEDDDFLVPCPKCDKEIYDDVDQCPYCREYLSSSDFEKQTPTWIVAIVVLTIISILLLGICV